MAMLSIRCAGVESRRSSQRDIWLWGVSRAHDRIRVSGGESAVWQRRFWEHTIEEEFDFERHVDYIHYNPVKHCLVARPGDWRFSSFLRWVRQGHYPPDWGSITVGTLGFEDLDETAMEWPAL